VLSFVRKGTGGELMLVISNMAPVVHHGFRVGVPAAGQWLEKLNTDSAFYGGSNVGTPLGAASSEAVASHGRAQSLLLTLPPLATVFLQWTG
jgi:1,4-alpha-glucan branching enzyme